MCSQLSSILLFDHLLESIFRTDRTKIISSHESFSLRLLLISLTFIFPSFFFHFHFIQFFPFFVFRHKNISSPRVYTLNLYVSIAYLDVLHCLNLVILSQWYLILLMLLYFLWVCHFYFIPLPLCVTCLCLHYRYSSSYVCMHHSLIGHSINMFSCIHCVITSIFHFSLRRDDDSCEPINHTMLQIFVFMSITDLLLMWEDNEQQHR